MQPSRVALNLNRKTSADAAKSSALGPFLLPVHLSDCKQRLRT